MYLEEKVNSLCAWNLQIKQIPPSFFMQIFICGVLVVDGVDGSRSSSVVPDFLFSTSCRYACLAHIQLLLPLLRVSTHKPYIFRSYDGGNDGLMLEMAFRGF